MGRQLSEREGDCPHWKLCQRTSGKKTARRASLNVHLCTVAVSPLFFSFWPHEKEPEAVRSSWSIRDTVCEPVRPLLGWAI